MAFLAHHPLYALGYAYLIILIVRAVLSWFPYDSRSSMASVNHWLSVMTEPYLRLFRRVVPPIGMFDVSYVLAVLVVWAVCDLVLVRLSW